MQKVAFFDIDGTLFRSSLLIELVEACIYEGVFPESARDIYREDFLNWQNRTGTYEAYITSVIKSYMEHLQGVHYGVFADLGRRVVEERGKRTYRYTRDLIHNLKSDGYFLVAISQSPKTILDAFCTSYGFDKVYGRIYEIGPRDCFTGKVVDEDIIKDKARVVARVFEREAVSKEGSIGVGDTEGDIPLLELVETPICFNPNMSLYEEAKNRNWKVIVERKDVIYTL